MESRVEDGKYKISPPFFSLREQRNEIGFVAFHEEHEDVQAVLRDEFFRDYTIKLNWPNSNLAAIALERRRQACVPTFIVKNYAAVDSAPAVVSAASIPVMDSVRRVCNRITLFYFLPLARNLLVVFYPHVYSSI